MSFLVLLQNTISYFPCSFPDNTLFPPLVRTHDLPCPCLRSLLKESLHTFTYSRDVQYHNVVISRKYVLCYLCLAYLGITRVLSAPILIILLAIALIGSVVYRESCTISFIVTFADYVYLYDVCDSENKFLTYVG